MTKAPEKVMVKIVLRVVGSSRSERVLPNLRFRESLDQFSIFIQWVFYFSSSEFSECKSGCDQPLTAFAPPFNIYRVDTFYPLLQCSSRVSKCEKQWACILWNGFVDHPSIALAIVGRALDLGTDPCNHKNHQKGSLLRPNNIANWVERILRIFSPSNALDVSCESIMSLEDREDGLSTTWIKSRKGWK